MGFTDKIKKKLEGDVGGICSYKHCLESTTAPGLNLGEAAHIYSESEGGPERKGGPGRENIGINSEENGIWLCRKHHKEIDSNAHLYSFGLLSEMKSVAQKIHRYKVEDSSIGAISNFIAPLKFSSIFWGCHPNFNLDNVKGKLIDFVIGCTMTGLNSYQGVGGEVFNTDRKEISRKIEIVNKGLSEDKKELLPIDRELSGPHVEKCQGMGDFLTAAKDFARNFLMQHEEGLRSRFAFPLSEYLYVDLPLPFFICGAAPSMLHAFYCKDRDDFEVANGGGFYFLDKCIFLKIVVRGNGDYLINANYDFWECGIVDLSDSPVEVVGLKSYMGPDSDIDLFFDFLKHIVDGWGRFYLSDSRGFEKVTFSVGVGNKSEVEKFYETKDRHSEIRDFCKRESLTIVYDRIFFEQSFDIDGFFEFLAKSVDKGAVGRFYYFLGEGYGYSLELIYIPYKYNNSLGYIYAQRVGGI